MPRPRDLEFDVYGRPLPDISGMKFPVRHQSCGQVHDAAKGEVVARYADCTRWRCPHCDGICDDRPLGWGGNVEELTLRGQDRA